MSIAMIALGAVTIAGVIGMRLSKYLPTDGNLPPVPFSDDAVAIIDRATHEARTRGSEVVTPEHLLLALLSETTSGLRALLMQDGVDVTSLLDLLQGKQAVAARTRVQAVPVYTTHAQDVLANATRAAFAAKCDAIGPMQLLEGILHDNGTHASRVLRQAGVSLHFARARSGSTSLP